MGSNYKRTVYSCVKQKGFPKLEALETFHKDMLILPPPNLRVGSPLPLNWMDLLFREILFLFFFFFWCKFHLLSTCR